MTMLRCAAAAAILAASVATAGAQQLTGRYQVIGDNGNGTGYRGVAEISGTAGGNCAIRWAIVNTPPTQGFCMRQGNVLSAAYRLGNSIGLVVYRLNDDGTLDGTWTIAGQEGVGKERLVPQR
ncbi:MAG: hypothetical protein JNK84_02670 [Phreatobacter sp.]|uniref:hypothetical protein n=1 Tax=Phreatobacter sp. TaxID=1966341 RepID=UPI001A483401|nr:hypothetical protein [Phreatobacter sp.]MBL8567966.1 hypothetical protein [Phreatobacter sp.]